MDYELKTLCTSVGFLINAKSHQVRVITFEDIGLETFLERDTKECYDKDGFKKYIEKLAEWQRGFIKLQKKLNH